MAENRKDLPIQVGGGYYNPQGYDELHRWISYWHQIHTILKPQPRTVLEIGKGTGVVSNYLRATTPVQITTFDFDPRVRPDVVGSVHELERHFAQGSFDMVCAFQVLEHLPFELFGACLAQMGRVSRQWVVISLPENGKFASLQIHFWRWKFSWGRKWDWFGVRRRWQFDGQHYWEINTRGHEPAAIRRAVPSTLQLQEEFLYPEYPYHRCYVFRRTDADQWSQPESTPS
jgi:hypothetical protein